MTSKLINIFSVINLDDDQAVASVMENFSLVTKEHQADCLNGLREDLQFTAVQFQAMLQISKSAYLRLVSGESKIQPVQLRLLVSMLYLRVTNPELFNLLCHVQDYDDHRQMPRFRK